MILLPLWTNTTIPTYMLPLLYNITFLFIYIIMVFFFCSVVSEVYWLLFGLRLELLAPLLTHFWSAILEVFAVIFFLRPPIFDNPRGSLRTWHSQFFVPDMVMHFYIQILVYNCKNLFLVSTDRSCLIDQDLNIKVHNHIWHKKLTMPCS